MATPQTPIQEAAANTQAAADAVMNQKVEPETRQSGKNPMPEGWTSKAKEVKWNPQTSDAFGAISAGDSIGEPVGSLIDGKPTKIEEPATEEGVTEEGAIPADDTLEKPLTEEEQAAKGDETPAEEPAAEAEKTVESVVVEPESALRRRLLNAVKAEAEKREVTARLQEEQAARAAEKASYEQERALLKTAPLEERLRLLGVGSRDELMEALITGEIKEITPPAPVKKEADPEVAALRADLEALKAEKERNAAIVAQAQAAQTAANVRAELSKPEYAFPITLAVENGVEDTIEHARNLWAASGAVAGTEKTFLLRAAKEAEAFFAAKYAPVIAAVGGKPPATVAPDGPVIKTPVVPAKKVIQGKKLTAGGKLGDDLPDDPMLRDAMIKKEMGWG